MTVTTTSRSAGPYTGVGTVNVYAFAFKVFLTTDVLVQLTSASGLLTAGVLGTDYSVSLNADQDGSPGGNVILTVALPTSASLTIGSQVPLTQLVVLTNPGNFYPRIVSDALDKVTILIQQALSSIAGAIRVPEVGAVPVLPSAAQRAGNLLGFDGAGNPIAVVAAAQSATALALALLSGAGSTFVNYLESGVGAVLRNIQGMFRDRPLSPRSFGCAVDGTTDDTAGLAACITAAIASGRDVEIPEGILVSGKQTITGNVTIRGKGRYVSCFKSKAGTNDHGLYVVGDFKLTVRDLEIDGNYVNNPTIAPNYPCGVLVPVGSLDIQGCYVHGWRDHSIHTGNTDYQYSAGAYAHDVFIIGNVVDQGNAAAALFDCIRVHRTQRVQVTGNICKGGDSSIRSNYYCDSIDISHNLCFGNWNDVGVTLALSTNVTAIGNRCWSNGQHGVEVDGCKYGVVSGNVCVSNVKNGIMITEYGPPAGASYQGAYIDGTSLTYPNVYSNTNVRVADNVCVGNGQFGIRCTGQADVVIASNTIEGNNTGNANPYGLYIEGGVGNKDDVLVVGNDFRNTGNQASSIGQANVQGQTRTGGNFHTPGTKQWLFAVKGTKGNELTTDPTLLLASSVATTPGAIVEDTVAAAGYARQINDTNGAGNLTINCLIPAVPLSGDKLIVVRIRTPDTMTACTVSVQLYLAGAFVATATMTNVTGLTTAYRELVYRVSDASKATPFDNIKVQIDTNVALTGKLNIESVRCFTTTEL